MVLANCRVLVISGEFSKTPGPRTRAEGPFSAEEFLETVLLPRFEEAESHGEKLLVDLDGGFGYGTSFLEESFGGLARMKSPAVVLAHLDFKSEEEPYLVADINRFIERAVQK